MSRAVPGQTSFLGDGNDDGDDDPGQSNPFEEGHRAYDPQQPAGDLCPYGDCMADRRSRWLDGWASAKAAAEQPADPDQQRTRTVGQLGVDPETVLNMHRLTCGATETGKPVKVQPFEAWATKFLAVDPAGVDQHKPDGCRLVLVPIYQAKDWDAYYVEHVGNRYGLGERGKTEGAPNMIDHGEFAGLELKVGRSKFVMGSLQDAVFVVADDETESATDQTGTDDEATE
jgi:hypothetical protein